jgi:hypothetical protein
MSLTFTLTGKTSELSADHFPPISLEGEWVVGLLGFETYNSIPNIDKSNNSFYYEIDNQIITIPEGAYTVAELNEYLTDKLRVDFSLSINAITLQSKLDCSALIDFSQADSIGTLLGFSQRCLSPVDTPHSSDTASAVKNDKFLIEKTKNKFYFRRLGLVKVPEGSYEIDDIAQYIIPRLAGEDITFTLRGNKNTLRSELKCSAIVDFSLPGSIGSLLGFSPRKLSAGKLHVSDKVVDIFKINVIHIDCNIVSGTYKNGRLGHTLHEFFPRVSPGYKIVEVPGEVIYLPVNTRTIDNLNVRVTDQNGDLINFNGEELTTRLHLKRVSSNGVGNN